MNIAEPLFYKGEQADIVMCHHYPWEKGPTGITYLPEIKVDGKMWYGYEPNGYSTYTEAYDVIKTFISNLKQSEGEE